MNAHPLDLEAPQACLYCFDYQRSCLTLSGVRILGQHLHSSTKDPLAIAWGSVTLSPAARAELSLMTLILGLAPQALCCRPLRGLIVVQAK